MKNINEYDEITHLMQKVTWPTPSPDLAFRIQNQVSGQYVPSETSDYKSPVMTVMAVILAVFFGLASGMAAGGQASANNYETSMYGTTSHMSVMNLYAGQ